MKKKSIILLLLCTCLFRSLAQDIQFAKIFQEAELQTRLMLQEIEKAKQAKPELVSPRSLNQGELKNGRFP